jgi:hypothetical protein
MCAKAGAEKMEVIDNLPGKLKYRDRLILAGLIGLLACIISIYISRLAGNDAGDLRYSLWPARDWLAGKDPYLPYKLNLDPFAVPYPFTAVVLVSPLTWLPDRMAAGVLTGLGSGILAWLILSQAKNWRLLLFLSWPFVNSLFFTQWAPYAASMFFTPSLLLIVLIKPQLALPFVLTQKPNRTGLFLAGGLLLISLALFPSWPVEWMKTLHNYTGYPPLFFLPLGPLILLALIRYREKRAWLLVLLAAMPQRVVYDQLGVLLVAENRKQLLFLMLCSWISLPVIFYYHGWENVPWGWQNWILIESYLPALLVVLLPTLRNMISKANHKSIVHDQN